MILIVEDDALARRALQSLFAANGYPSQAVNSAEDALALLQHESDEAGGLALIDIDLPGMSGLQLLKYLQEKHPKLACTLMSANEHNLSAFTGSRAVSFLHKPLDLKRLLIFLRGERAQTH